MPSRPRRAATLAAAAVATAAMLTAPATPAQAATPCAAITGTVITPHLNAAYSPGLSATPAVQSVRIDDDVNDLTGTNGFHVTLTCVGLDRQSTIDSTMFLWFVPFSGTSTGSETIGSGSGTLGGPQALGVATGATREGSVGMYFTQGVVTADTELTYVRSGLDYVLAIGFRNITVDADQDGPIPPDRWGDAVAAANVAARPTTSGVSGSTVRSLDLQPAVAAVASA